MNQPQTAGDICSRVVAIAYPSLALAEAARLMHRRHVGCLVIVEERSASESIVVGVLTDRDVAMGVVAADRDPQGLRVGDLMSKDVVTVSEQDSLLDVVAAMQRRKVRRVPVTDAREALVGLVSLDDVLAAMAQQMLAVASAVSAAARHERTELP